MAFTNFDTKEINCKIIYFGADHCGKSENLRSIYASTADEMKSGIMELDDPDKGSKYFDFLPISLGHVNDFHIKLHLFTLPAKNLFETVASVLLKGVDGFVFVVDSRLERLAANIECYRSVDRLFREEGYDLGELPRVVQYNKRDLSGLVPLDVLREELNPFGGAEQEAIASESVGTMETLQVMAKQILVSLAPSG